MNSDRSPRECVEYVVKRMDHWITKGLCQTCAITVVASLTDIAPATVEQIWIDHNVKLLDAETALD